LGVLKEQSLVERLKGTHGAKSSYTEPDELIKLSLESNSEVNEREVWEMSDVKSVLRIVGIILLGVFVLAVGIPVVLTAALGTLGILGFLFHLAVILIKAAVVLAIVYLILVGIRALLR
jgi:hypothetical protein